MPPRWSSFVDGEEIASVGRCGTGLAWTVWLNGNFFCLYPYTLHLACSVSVQWRNLIFIRKITSCLNTLSHPRCVHGLRWTDWAVRPGRFKDTKIFAYVMARAVQLSICIRVESSCSPVSWRFIVIKISETSFLWSSNLQPFCWRWLHQIVVAITVFIARLFLPRPSTITPETIKGKSDNFTWYYLCLLIRHWIIKGAVR